MISSLEVDVSDEMSITSVVAIRELFSVSEINRLDLLLNLSCLKGAFDLIPRFDFRALDVKLSAPRAADDSSKFSAALKDL